MSERNTTWRVRHRPVTESTNQDARNGKPGDVFTADHQTAGRGRLDHRWLSSAGENLMMSAVIGVDGMPPDEVATLPLVVGLAVARVVMAFLPEGDRTAVRLKWPNDVLVEGRKVCGILCERCGECVIAGIGVNVNQAVFPDEIADRATSLALSAGKQTPVVAVRDAVLDELEGLLGRWRCAGFASLWDEISRLDFLKGRSVAVLRTDDDKAPLAGICGGIRADGALDVAGEAVFAGEAHLSAICGIMHHQSKRQK